MKLFLFLLGLSTFSWTKAQTFDDPVKYNDYLIGLQTELGQKFIAFNEKLGQETATYEIVLPYYDQLLAKIDEVLAKIKKVTPYDKNTAFQDAFVNLISYYKTAVSVDYKEMLKIIYLDTNPDYERMTAVYEKVVKEEAAVDKAFQAEQEKYAKKYKIDLLENELQEEFDAE